MKKSPALFNAPRCCPFLIDQSGFNWIAEERFNEHRLKRRSAAQARSPGTRGRRKEKNMPIWLKGVGRSREELTRILRESNGGKDPYPCYRRSHDRHQLDNAHGELIYMESNTPCQVLEISVGGCSLLAEKPFRPGALAPVEIVLPILGMVLHIGGVTQWVRKERQVGVHFTHVNSDSKQQVECLIDGLIGRRTVESVKESIAFRQLNLLVGDVLAEQPFDIKPAYSALPGTQQMNLAYDRLVHRGEGRLHTRKEGEWPVVFQSPTSRVCCTGAIVDLSLGGCTVRTTRPFAGEVYEPLEVRFDMLGQHFLFSGLARVIYDPHCMGVQFNPMSHHKREGLALLLVELCAATRTQLDVG